MVDFATAIESSGLGASLLANGRAPLNQPAADLAVTVAKAEPISASLISFTHCCEYGFETSPLLPNVNGNAKSPWNWDFGAFGLNLQWSMRSIFQGEFKSDGLLFTDVFGHSFYEADGVTPCGFNGSLLANGRLAARRLLAVKAAGLSEPDATRFRALKFTGPLHQEKRGILWDALHENFDKFFALYQT